jgi:hypothetical protein
MFMSVCYLDCHEAGLCCYLLIQIQNLLHRIQLISFICGPCTDCPQYY